MTLIPLDDPIWSRLYGAYGVRDVPGKLRQLNTAWNEDVAQELFWEELHNQETLYPVTYAALPWLWEIGRNQAELPISLVMFCSHVLFCVVSENGDSSGSNQAEGELCGVSLNATDHEHDWIPKEKHLTNDDMGLLHRVQAWFNENKQELSDQCLSCIALGDAQRAPHLAIGPVALAGGLRVAYAIEMWSEGEPIDDIIEEYPPERPDAQVASAFATRIAGQAQELSAFLKQYAAEFIN